MVSMSLMDVIFVHRLKWTKRDPSSLMVSNFITSYQPLHSSHTSWNGDNHNITLFGRNGDVR